MKLTHQTCVSKSQNFICANRQRVLKVVCSVDPHLLSEHSSYGMGVPSLLVYSVGLSDVNFVRIEVKSFCIYGISVVISK